MKNKIVILGSVALFSLGLAAVGYGDSITGSKHDLSFASNPGPHSAAATTKVCEYCHAPHNAFKNVPLWNRADPSTAAASITLYKNSATMSAAGEGAVLSANSISLMCLSCHLESVVNMNANTKDTALKTIGLTGAWITGDLNTGAKLLSDDHPVGFSYITAQTQRGGAGNVGTPLVAAASGKVDTLPLFVGATAGVSTDIECSTCHKVHDKAIVPFLRKPQNTLCATCHTN